MKEYLDLYLVFAKIGAFMFGGGYAMLPLLIRELVEKRNWSSENELLDYFAIAQCTPGVIAVNTATFVGHKRNGTIGGIVATLGVISVPLVLIILIAAVLSNFWTQPIVKHIFGGIRIAVAGLIVSAVIKLFRSNVKNWFGIALCIVSFVVIAFLNLSPIIVVLISAVCGLIYGRASA